jgi:hypothetical protein
VYSETYSTSTFPTFEECLQAFLDESEVCMDTQQPDRLDTVLYTHQHTHNKALRVLDTPPLPRHDKIVACWPAEAPHPQRFGRAAPSWSEHMAVLQPAHLCPPLAELFALLVACLPTHPPFRLSACRCVALRLRQQRWQWQALSRTTAAP